MRFQVTPVAVESDVDSSDLFGDQRALGGPDHPDGDIRVAAQQIFIRVRQCGLHRDLRVKSMKIREDRGENFASNDFARGDAYGSTFLIDLTGCAYDGMLNVHH